MSIISVIIIFAVINLLEVPRLLKQKAWKELLTFSLLMLFSITIAILQVLNIDLPNPTKGIEFLAKKLIKIQFGFKQ